MLRETCNFGSKFVLSGTNGVPNLRISSDSSLFQNSELSVVRSVAYAIWHILAAFALSRNL